MDTQFSSLLDMQRNVKCDTLCMGRMHFLLKNVCLISTVKMRDHIMLPSWNKEM